MTAKFTRRQFIMVSLALSMGHKVTLWAANGKGHTTRYPMTYVVLENAYSAETIAYQHYVAYASQALLEGYLNIAYLFQAFAVSEDTHASNYARLIGEMGQKVPAIKVPLAVRDTKTNLLRAASKEVEKIDTVYPAFLKDLEAEAYPDAIELCIYSWHSHKQHEAKIREIQKYAGVFFGTVAEELEGLKLDFHVCRICGSTIDEPPVGPCVICSRPKMCYHSVARPGQ